MKRLNIATSLNVSGSMARLLSFQTFCERLVTGPSSHEDMILRSRIVPAIEHKGKIYLGQRGKAHSRIPIPGAAPDAKMTYGFHDPLTKKFYKRSDVWVDATELTPTG